jgi:hypothetical protein
MSGYRLHQEQWVAEWVAVYVSGEWSERERERESGEGVGQEVTVSVN